MSKTATNAKPLYPVLFAVSIFHLMNDTLQSVLPALFPIIEAKLSLNYWVSGIMFGLAFGLGGVGSIVFGKIGDIFGLPAMMLFCSLIPLIGLLVFFLPDENDLETVE